ncbi:MAG: glycosyltransferase [Burkholderiaceae bacterium]
MTSGLRASPQPSASPVAILLAVHRGADVAHFREALASLRDQAGAALRLFVFADGELTGAHEAVLTDFIDPTNGDVVLRSAQGAGLPAALNRLIDRALRDADVEFLARMDADDVCLPGRIRTQVEFLRARPDVALAGTWCIEFSEPGVPLFHKRLPTQWQDVLDFMVCRSPLAHPTVMFRRAVFEAGHRYDIRLPQMQDYDLWSRLVQAGYVISNVPEYLLWYRMAPGFFKRRSGWIRAWKEVRMRLVFARRLRLLSGRHVLKLGALFMSRIAPERVKHFLYMRMR